MLEKAVDFSQLDADLMIAAIEEMVRQLPPPPPQQEPAPRFSAKNSKPRNFGQNPMSAATGEQS